MTTRLWAHAAQSWFVDLFAFLVIAGVSISMPLLPLTLYVKSLIALGLCLPAAHLFASHRAVFVPALFFVINAVLSPFVFAALSLLPFRIPQLYFVPPIILYLAIVLRVPSLRKHITWLRWGRLNARTVVLGIVLTLGSIFALVAWAFFIADDLSKFRQFIPEISVPLLLAYGVFFAVFNSFIEEFLARAVLFDAFSGIFARLIPVIVAQAVVFSLWHFDGFPGGVVGVGLVFIWSLMLGAMKHTSGGMLAPLVAHFVADGTIALVLFLLLVVPN